MRRRFGSRLPVFVFAMLLAFKAAVPLLAALAASNQGLATAEICSVYGVALPHGSPASDLHGPASAHHGMAGHGAQPSTPDPHRPGDHAGTDHCALTALAALAAGLDDAAWPPLPQGAEAADARRSDAAAPRPDRAALWAALLGHAPPAFS